MSEFSLPDLNGIGNTEGVFDAIASPLITLVWVSVIFTVAFLVLYVASFVHKWRVQRAIFDIRDSVREMNDRDKNREQRQLNPAGKHIVPNTEFEQTSENATEQ